MNGKRVWIALLLAALATETGAQERTDSLPPSPASNPIFTSLVGDSSNPSLASNSSPTSESSTASSSIESSKTVTPKDFILPVGLAAAGTTGLFQPVKNWKYELQDAVHNLGGQNQSTWEDYVQYIPAAAAISLGWTGMEAKHGTIDRLMLSGTSWLMTASLTWALLKRNVISIRPGIHYTYVATGHADAINPKDNPKYFNSFPSGHSATAFMGAELIRLEYGEEYPWVAAGAYAMAAGVGLMRIYHDYHWATDIVAGAGMGILGARIGWWLLPYEQILFHKLFHNEVTILPTTDGQTAALSLTVSFSIPQPSK